MRAEFIRSTRRALLEQVRGGEAVDGSGSMPRLRVTDRKMRRELTGATAYLKFNRARELKSLRKLAKLLGSELVDGSSGEVRLNPVS